MIVMETNPSQQPVKKRSIAAMLIVVVTGVAAIYLLAYLFDVVFLYDLGSG